MERKTGEDRKVRTNGASRAETEAERRRRCGEDQSRLNVETNSFEDDTKPLHRAKDLEWS